MTPTEQLRQAVTVEGRSPALHQATMFRHRQEWPTLWAAIDRILDEKRLAEAENRG